MDQSTITRAYMTELFTTLAYDGFGRNFLDHLHEQIQWTATGTSPVSGVTKHKQEYEKLLSRLSSKVKTTIRRVVDRILVDGQWTAVSFHTSGVEALDETDFSMQYCWLMKVEGGKIVEVVRYYDQKKMSDLFGTK